MLNVSHRLSILLVVVGCRRVTRDGPPVCVHYEMTITRLDSKKTIGIWILSTNHVHCL